MESWKLQRVNATSEDSQATRAPLCLLVAFCCPSAACDLLAGRALTTICVDEVPAPRSRPTTVMQGNGGL